MAPIEHVYPNTEIQKYSKAGEKQRAQDTRPSLGYDGFFISDEGKRLQQREQAIEVARKEIGHSAAIREDLVASIKEKLANGEYIQLSDEMAGVIAERIIAGLFLR